MVDEPTPLVKAWRLTWEGVSIESGVRTKVGSGVTSSTTRSSVVKRKIFPCYNEMG